MHPVRTRFVFALVALLIATPFRADTFGAATPTPRPSPAHLDHFLSYGVTSSKGTAAFVPLGPVSLPRLGGGPYDLLKVGSLLLPADKNAAGVHDSATHLLEYRLKPSKGTRKFSPLANVRVLNQCSDVFVELAKPVAVLVPTAKNLTSPVTAPANPPVDHLLCFDAKLQKKGPGGVALPKFPKGVQVQVADQFQSRRYELTSVTRLCVPTGKSGAPLFLKGADKGKPAPLAPASVKHADEHLLCYKAKLATTEVAQLGCGPATPGAKGTKIPKQPKHESRPGIFVANQLGSLRLDTTKEVELCVPSLAELPIVEGLLALPGDPQQPVSEVTFDLSRSPGWTDAETTLDPSSGGRMLRTRLGIFFTDDATVGAVNALLTRLGAEIVMMVAGAPYVVVRIPDPRTLDALKALAAEIEANPAVEDVSLDAIPELDLLPSNFPRPDGDLGQEQGLLYIDHLLQARAAPAWNARAAIKQAPALVIADGFGDGPPGASISAEYPNREDFALGKPVPDGHGYQTLGVIAAVFGNDFGPANCFAVPPGPDSVGCATGIYPGNQAPRVRVADVMRLSWNEMEVKILLSVRSLKPDRVVVNASLGRFEVYGDVELARYESKRWIKMVRRSGLEEQFLLVVAAGNVRSDGSRDAKTSSSFTAASLLTVLPGSPDPPRLANVLVVENRKDTRFPFRPGGLHEKSKTGGHLSACGTNVWTVQPPLKESPGGWSGTSLASPLVAGVAAYVLSIAPELSVEEVRNLLLNNAQPQASGTTPALDAYATLLDIDRITNSGEPVRRAILDFVASGEINAEDVIAFFDGFYDLQPERRRWGRGDLRGAYEPQTDAVRFDLNRDGDFETVNVQVGTHQLQFDEQMVNADADIVCFTAFSTTGPYEAVGRVDPGRDRCCTHYKQVGRLPIDAKCFDCPARRRSAHPREVEEEPKPLGVWRLSPPSGLVIHELFFLEDGTVMVPLANSGRWEKTGTWTSTPHEVNGDVLYYDVRIDACTDAIVHTRYAFEGTWSPRPETDCFGVTSCFNGDSCPAMQGLLTTSDGVTTSPAAAVDSKRVQGVDGWEPLTSPVLNQCHGGCFEEWWRSGLLACAPLGGHCLETSAPTCGGVCLPGATCVNEGGSCTCVTEEP